MFIDHSIVRDAENIIIRTVTEADKEEYISLQFDDNLLNSFAQAGEIVSVDVREIFWKERYESDSILFSIVEKDTGCIAGFCEIDHISEDEPTIGITLLDKYRGRGYGYLAAKMMIEAGWEILEHPYFVWEVHQDNEPSKRLVEKLGGKLINRRCAIPEYMLKVLQEGGMDIQAKDFPESIERYRLERPKQ